MSEATAIASTRFAPASLVQRARSAIVVGCGLALILAGPVLPF